MTTVYHASEPRSASEKYQKQVIGAIFELAAKYRRLWPERQEAITAAVGFIRRGNFERQPAGSDGADVWQIDSYVTSRAGNCCTCGSQDISPDPRFGLLCAHRLAAVILYNVYPRVGFSPISAIAQEAASAAKRRTGAPAAVDLMITAEKDYQSPDGIVLVTGYRIAGQPEERLHPSDQFWIAPLTVSMEIAPHLRLCAMPAKGLRTREYIYQFSSAGYIPATGYNFAKHDAAYYAEFEEKKERRQEQQIGDMQQAAATLADTLSARTGADPQIAGAEAAGIVAAAMRRKGVITEEEINAAAVRLIAKVASRQPTTRNR